MEIVLNLRDGKGWGFMESNLRHGYQEFFAGLRRPRPSGSYKVRIEDLYLALRNVIKLYYASLKARFSKVQSCLNILNEFERRHNHTRFTELYVPIE